jgi:ATP-dependent DNA helicase RecG
MTTTPEQFQHWLEEPEGTRIEFKSAGTTFHFDKLLEYCVALANEGGGRIILGVTDRRPRTVVGTEAFAEPGRTEAGLHQRLGHRIHVEEYHHQGRRVLIVHVPARLPGTAWNLDGRYLKRAGDELTALGDAELKAIFAETSPDFSAEPCPAILADLDPRAIAEFRTRWEQKTGNQRLLQTSDEQLLRDADLMDDGRILNAALILFGTPKALVRHLAQAEIIFEYRSAEAAGPAQARHEFREGFLLIHDTIWQQINLRNDRQSYQDGLFRNDIPTFDEAAVREAVLNAVAHREYRLGGSIFVRQYSRRLEIDSPGGFPPGITLENIIDEQNPRNRRLAESLARCGFVERAGQGMNLIFERMIRQSKALPSFAGSAEHSVRLHLDGLVRDPAFVRFLERVGAEQLRSFSTYDFLALDAIARDLPLTEPLRRRLPALVEIGAVEMQGRGRGTRYFLSRALYDAIGRSGVYTRQKGLDHETNKALLVKHLEECGEKGAPMMELCQVLPAMPRRAIQQLLQELRKDRRAVLGGTRRWARWYAAAPGEHAHGRH